MYQDILYTLNTYFLISISKNTGVALPCAMCNSIYNNIFCLILDGRMDDNGYQVRWAKNEALVHILSQEWVINLNLLNNQHTLLSKGLPPILADSYTPVFASHWYRLTILTSCNDRPIACICSLSLTLQPSINSAVKTLCKTKCKNVHRTHGQKSKTICTTHIYPSLTDIRFKTCK